MNDPQMAAGPMFVMLMVLVYVIVLIVSLGLTVLIWCRLFGRAGFHWAFGFLMIVPIANIVMPFYLAFAEWPILRQLKTLQNRPAQSFANPSA